jgi:hypothetical protein
MKREVVDREIRDYYKELVGVKGRCYRVVIVVVVRDIIFTNPYVGILLRSR